MEHYVTHVLDPEDGGAYRAGPDDYWLCFHCGEKFTAGQEDAARRHFGTLPPYRPACWFGKEQLITLLLVCAEQNRSPLLTIASLIEEAEREDEDG